MSNFEKIMTLVLRNNIFVGKSDYSFELPMLFIQDNKVYMALITTFNDTEVGVITFCFQDGSIKYYTKEEFVRYKVVTINSRDKDIITKDFVNFTEEELIKDFTDIIDKYINEKQLDIDKYNNYLDKVIKSTEDEYGRIYISKFKI